MISGRNLQMDLHGRIIADESVHLTDLEILGCASDARERSQAILWIDRKRRSQLEAGFRIRRSQCCSSVFAKKAWVSPNGFGGTLLMIDHFGKSVNAAAHRTKNLKLISAPQCKIFIWISAAKANPLSIADVGLEAVQQESDLSRKVSGTLGIGRYRL